MGAYIIRRLLMGLVVLIIVSVLIFGILHLLPGDPLMLYIGSNEITTMSTDQIDQLRHQYGLDRPLVIQYFNWMGGILRGDLGTSVYYKVNVGTLITERLPVTFFLGLLSFCLSSILGITFGVICALRRGKWPDIVVTILANIGITAPAFWVGILLIYFLSLKLNILPTYGFTSPFSDPWLSFRQLIMPVICLSLFALASLTRQTRSSMLEVTQQDYIRTAWAKGLKERLVVLRHTVKNALIPVITAMGMQVNIMFGGAVLIETVFNISGMGRLLRDAVFGKDYMVVEGAVLIIAFVVVLTNMAVDISYGWIDPRIRYN
jgi:peptide/nickel transport system permease protein